MLGSATFTTLASSTTMNWATATIASTVLALARPGSLRVSVTSGIVVSLARVDGVGDPLSEHDRRGVDRHRWNDRNDRRVDHAEPIDPAHRAERVHHRPGVLLTAHGRCRGGVSVGGEVGRDRVGELVVSDRLAGQD